MLNLLLTGESTVRVGKVDLAVLLMEGPEGPRIQTKDVKLFLKIVV